MTDPTQATNPEGFTPALLAACAARCADVGDPPCWKMPELCDPCEHVTPCDECRLNVLTQATEAMAEALRFYRDGFRLHQKNGKSGLRSSEWKPTEVLLDDCGNFARAALARYEAAKEKTDD